MITFNSESTGFKLKDKAKIKIWVTSVIRNEGKRVGAIAYVFCSDEYLLNLNQQYLKHSTLTDILTFDYCENNLVSGDIVISVERIAENAKKYSKTFEEELSRVMAHGVLHLCGYKDKTPADKTQMTDKENEALKTCPVL
ncbi:MAG: rRNA maturation RNase YbeY [Bacteroidales bacterium]|nr:rRNA maturation RNase YbeY [Bacteroidales bacterium]